MLNTSTVMGRLTRDPEMRTAGSANVCSFTLACDRDFKDKSSGERGVDFIDVVAWRATADFVGKYFTKGRVAVAHGRLQVRDWTDKEGNKRRTAEIIADTVYFGDTKPKESGANGGYTPPDDFIPDFNPNEMPGQSAGYPSGYNNGGHPANQPQQGQYNGQQQGYNSGYNPNQNNGYDPNRR